MVSRSPQSADEVAGLNAINRQLDAVIDGLSEIMDSLERVLPDLDNHPVDESIIDRLRAARPHFASVAARLTRLGTNLARLADELHPDTRP